MDDVNLCVFCIGKVLVLLSIANGMPVIARKLFGSRFSQPVDYGIRFFDGRPLFGHSKTWRGLVASILTSALLAPLLGFTMDTGVWFSVFTMCGDLFSSFAKRRLGYVESSKCRILDIIPESSLPILLLYKGLELSYLDGIFAVALFFLSEVTLSPLLYRLHIRKRPY